MVRRVLLSLVATAVVAMAQPGPTSAVLIVYTLVAVPVTTTAEVVTAFNMTLTNVLGPDELGCLEVTLPLEYEIHSVSDPVGPPGRDWSSSVDGNTVVVWSESGGGRLEILQSATFTIIAMPKEAGLTTWSHHAHRSQNCDGSEQVGIPVEVVVLPPLLPTPTPEPTPRPTPKPTPTPTPPPTPTPVPSLPVPSIGLPPGPEPEPTRPPTSSAPHPTPTPSASDDEEPARPGHTDPDDGAVVATPPSSGSSGSGGDGDGAGAPVAIEAPRVAFDDPRLDLGSLEIDLLAGVEVWSVPAATLGVPGLLLLLWVALQAVGALAWIPAVKRLRGDGEEWASTAARSTGSTGS